MLKKNIDQYKGRLRSWKWVYVVNNFLQSKRLRHNRRVLRELGLDHNVYASVGTANLPKTDALPWLDQPDPRPRLTRHPIYLRLPGSIQEQFETFLDHGYIILKKHYSDDEIDQHNAIVDDLLQKGEIYTNYNGVKMMDVYKKSSYIDQHFFQNPLVMDILTLIFDKKVIPFQTIHFNKGSEQRAHSDYIHMSTYPPGYLVGVWTALEDVGEDQGPLFYYPGSHRWPYVSCADYSSGNTTWSLGEKSYARYEDYVEQKIQNSGLQKKFFFPEKGDVLIWHANLLHGGSMMKDRQRTRRSMVGHYYADEVFCYHEISQRPALMDVD